MSGSELSLRPLKSTFWLFLEHSLGFCNFFLLAGISKQTVEVNVSKAQNESVETPGN